jgi:hypothetical protein
MLKIKKKYVVDEKKRPFAVQVDIETFEKMEKLIEDYALGQLISENNPNDILTIEESKAYYKNLIKK